MNESIDYDLPLTQRGGTTAVNEPNLWGRVTKYDPFHTPDLSHFSQTGTLMKAQFPYEYYQVQNQWARSGRLLDRSEGAVGNSIFMRKGTYVDVPIKKEAIDQIMNSQRFSLNFWFRANDIKYSTLVQIRNFLHVNLIKGTIGIKYWDHQSKFHVLVGKEKNGSLISKNRWKHISSQFDKKLSLYIDGEEVASLPTATGLDKSKFLSAQAHLVLGPQVNLSPNARVDMDEVYIYATSSSPREIAKMAHRKEIETELPGASENIKRIPAQINLIAHVPDDNKYSPSVLQLGELLFKTQDLSHRKTMSCATCHKIEDNFMDGEARSLGDDGISRGLRNTPSIVGLIFQERFRWDQSAPSLESQVLHPILSASEMNMTADEIVGRLKTKLWLERFATGFGPGAKPSLTLVAKALATYIRQINYTPSSFDFATDPLKTTLSPSEQRGWRVFNGRANCVACHSGPMFTDGILHDTGLSVIVSPSRPLGDLGAFWSTERRSDRLGFVTPSLRNINQTGPYFHDGRAKSLAEVVEFYNKGGDLSARNRPSKSLLVRPLNLTFGEKNDLVDFLKALDSGIHQP